MNDISELNEKIKEIIQSPGGQSAAIRFLVSGYGLSYQEAVAQVRPAYNEVKGSSDGKRKSKNKGR